MINKNQKEKYNKCWHKKKSSWLKNDLNDQASDDQPLNSQAYPRWRGTSSYWRGTYKCIQKNCKVTFILAISEKPAQNADVKISVLSIGEPTHGILFGKVSCQGKIKETLERRLLADSITTVRNENIIYNNSSSSGSGRIRSYT